MDRKVSLPDDVLRTKTFVLHPATLEEATEQLDQVLSLAPPEPFLPHLISGILGRVRFDWVLVKTVYARGFRAPGSRHCPVRKVACL